MVHKLTHKALDRNAKHLDVDCTYSIVHDDSGNRYLQLDTYGSAERKTVRKVSQSLRFSPDAIAQLKDLLRDQF